MTGPSRKNGVMALLSSASIWRVFVSPRAAGELVEKPWARRSRFSSVSGRCAPSSVQFETGSTEKYFGRYFWLARTQARPFAADGLGYGEPFVRGAVRVNADGHAPSGKKPALEPLEGAGFVHEPVGHADGDQRKMAEIERRLIHPCADQLDAAPGRLGAPLQLVQHRLFGIQRRHARPVRRDFQRDFARSASQIEQILRSGQRRGFGQRGEELLEVGQPGVTVAEGLGPHRNLRAKPPSARCERTS